MHELSIASALLDQVRRHLPAGITASLVRIEAGPMQSIDPSALEFAWQSLVRNTDMASAQLELTVFPWKIRCTNCAREWESDDMFDACSSCGSNATTPTGTDELKLVSIEVDESPAKQRN